MDDVHGFGPDPQVEKFKKDSAVHIRFHDGGVHDDGAEYDHLKRFRKKFNGVTTIESNPEYLDAALELLGLEGAKDVPTPSVPAHKEQLMTGELLEPSENTVYRAVCRWSTLLHARQGRHTARGINSGVDAREADPRLDGCSEARDSVLEGTRDFVNKLELDNGCRQTGGETGWVSLLARLRLRFTWTARRRAGSADVLAFTTGGQSKDTHAQGGEVTGRLC